MEHQPLVYTLSVVENASRAAEGGAPRVRLLAPGGGQLAAPPPPPALAAAVLLVFLFAPTIIVGNALTLVAICRYKRLRTPSNYLLTSLATSDLGVGVYMPVGAYLELCDAPAAGLCLLNYSVPITLCCVSVLVMVAIAVDRFTSLARPLRYNNLITHTAMERYIAVFWIYAALVGAAPLTYHMFYGTPTYQSSRCSFGSLIPRPIQLFMFCAVYGPSAFILLACYGYIYVVARGHARAISEERHSLQYAHGAAAPRYGLALAITAGMFLTLWLPFQVCMLLDVFTGTQILAHWIVIYLALPIVTSSALNPWIYGYRNAELRLAVQRVVDDALTLLGFSYRSRAPADARAAPPSVAATARHTDCAAPHQPTAAVRRECCSWHADDERLLVPIAKPESSGCLSLDGERRACDNNNARQEHRKAAAGAATRCARTPLTHSAQWRFSGGLAAAAGGCNRPGLKGSRSMIESFAGLRHGSDVWIFKGNNLVINGASIV